MKSGRSVAAKLQVTVVVCAMVMVLGLSSGMAAAETGALAGTVTDATTGTPVEGAMVVGFGNHGHRRAITAADGTYEIPDLRVGDQNIHCWANGYLPAMAPVVIVEGQTTVLDFAVDPLAFGEVSGFVTEAGSGEAVEGAMVWLRPVGKALDTESGGHHGLIAMTGEDGSYHIPNVFAGDYSLSARAYGYLNSDPVDVVVGEGEIVTADLVLNPLAFGGAEGTVTDAVTGAPVEGARVFLLPSQDRGGSGGGGMGHGRLYTTTDESGFYVFEDLVTASYRAVILAPSYQRAGGAVEILEGQITTVDFSLQPLAYGSLEGFVTDSTTGDPVANAMVMLHGRGAEVVVDNGNNAKSGGWNFVRTDDSGFFRFDEVVTGEHRVRAFAQGYAHSGAEATVEENQTTVVEIALDPR